MKKQNLAQNTTLALPPQKGSHSIAKMKPKVRVVHLPTPEIIEIEPADFQKYVQSLTGKPGGAKAEFKKPEFSSKEAPIILCEEDSSDTEVEIVGGFHSSECSDRTTTGEQEMTNCGYLEDGYLIGFEDLDKFIAEFLDFPLLPLDWDDNQLA